MGTNFSIRWNIYIYGEWRRWNSVCGQFVLLIKLHKFITGCCSYCVVFAFSLVLSLLYLPCSVFFLKASNIPICFAFIHFYGRFFCFFQIEPLISDEFVHYCGNPFDQNLRFVSPNFTQICRFQLILYAVLVYVWGGWLAISKKMFILMIL